MVSGASKYFLLSGEFGDWGLWLRASISAVDESSIGLAMCCSIMVRRICRYTESTLGGKEPKRGCASLTINSLFPLARVRGI